MGCDRGPCRTTRRLGWEMLILRSLFGFNTSLFHSCYSSSRSNDAFLPSFAHTSWVPRSVLFGTTRQRPCLLPHHSILWSRYTMNLSTRWQTHRAGKEAHVGPVPARRSKDETVDCSGKDGKLIFEIEKDKIGIGRFQDCQSDWKGSVWRGEYLGPMIGRVISKRARGNSVEDTWDIRRDYSTSLRELRGDRRSIGSAHEQAWLRTAATVLLKAWARATTCPLPPR